MEHKVSKFYILCKNNAIDECSARFLLKCSTCFPLKRNHHASSTKHYYVANQSDFNLLPQHKNIPKFGLSFCPTPKFVDVIKICYDNGQFWRGRRQHEYFSLMEIPINHLYTFTAMKYVGLHTMVETH